MPDSFKIDAHVHVFTPDMPLIDNPRHAPKYSFTHEELMATLDANGIDRAVIAAASPWGDYNDYILAALRAHPARLRGTDPKLPIVLMTAQGSVEVAVQAVERGASDFIGKPFLTIELSVKALTWVVKPRGKTKP